MKSLQRLLVIPAALLAFGCKGSDSKNVDAALNSDLTTAAQARPYTPADSVSVAERAKVNSYTSAPAAVAAAPAPVRERTVVHDVYRTHPSSSSRASSGNSGGSYSPPAPVGPIDHVEKNTKRDAAIGAGAGAVIGAVTSKNKVKGGLIGGVVGGILGGVVGNNVDKKKVPNP
ncbi:MAG: YMGG-like glycine zipper-containing protein [Gemmatimonadaceae bacterium]